MIHENCVAYPRISAPGSVQHFKTSDASETQNGYPGKFNSFEWFFIRYVLCVLERHQYPINCFSFKIQSFQNQFSERQVIAQLCLLCVCWHWLSEIGLIYGNSDFWTMLSGTVDKSEGQAAIHRDVDMLKKWVNGKVMRLNKAKANSKVLHLGGGIPSINTGWGMSEIKPVLLRKTWGFWWRRSWRWACNVHSHNWIMVREGNVWFYFSQWTFRLHMHLVEHHLARQNGKSFLFG